MRAIVYPYLPRPDWQETYFPERSIYTLPLAGRNYGGHLLDCLHEAGVAETMLADIYFSPLYFRHLCQIHFWRGEWHYHGTRRGELRTVLDRFDRFCRGHEVIVLHGFLLPQASLRDIGAAPMTPVAEDAPTPPGIYLLRHDRLWRVELPYSQVADIHGYTELNFQLMHNPGMHVLPGYRFEGNVRFGANNTILEGADIQQPAILGNNLLLESKVKLLGDVIICNNVMVGRGTTLKRCIVLDNTYIGSHMELVDKIVCGSCVIDSVTGASVQLSDRGMTGELHQDPGMLDPVGVVEYLLAFLLMLGYTLPWLFLYLPFYFLWRKSIWRHRLSFDIYPRLWQVLFGKARLIALNHKEKNCVFRFGESHSNRWAPEELNDLFYSHRRSCGLSVRVTLKALINRLFAVVEPHVSKSNTEKAIAEMLAQLDKQNAG